MEHRDPDFAAPSTPDRGSSARAQAGIRPENVGPPARRAHWPTLAVEALFNHVPTFVALRLRTMALRAAGIRIGKATSFFGKITLLGSGNFPERLRIGEGCGFNEGCLFDLEDEIRIGDSVSVGQHVMFLTSTWEPGGPTRRAGKLTHAPIVVEDGSWLGARVTVMPGVTIGAGSIIGAGVVVTKDVAPNTLVSGPVRVSIAKWR